MTIARRRRSFSTWTAAPHPDSEQGVEGGMMGSGLSAYDLDAVRALRQDFIEHSMLYPPNWFFPTIAFTLFGPTLASDLWFVGSVVALYVSCLIILKIFFLPAVPKNRLGEYLEFFSERGTRLIPLTLGLFGFIALSKPFGMNVYLGNTGIIAYLGVCVLTFGMIRESRLLAVLGLVILMLKPQIGVTFAVVLLLDRFGRGVVIRAAIASILMAAPAFFFDDPAKIVSDYLLNMSVHGELGSNLPHRMTGIRNLVWRLSGSDMPTLVLLLASVGFAVLLSVIVRRSFQNEVQKTLLTMAICACAVTIFVPLHDYDFLILMPVVLSLGIVTGLPWGIALIASLGFTRLGEIAEPLFGSDNAMSQMEISSLIVTLSALAVFFVLCWALLGSGALSRGTKV